MERLISILNLPSDIKFISISALLIMGLTVMVYSNTWNNEFTNWDDQTMVVRNDTIRSLSTDNLKKMILPQKGVSYQPMRDLSYAIDYHFWRLDPRGYHLQSILFHGLSGIWLLMVLLKLLPLICRAKAANHQKMFRMVALYATILYIVHPINVESVTWLTSRKYVLLSFFSFCSFYFFIRSSEGGQYHFFLAMISVFTCMLAIMSSPFGIVLPVVFLLFDYCRDTSNNPFRVIGKRCLYYIPYGILGTIFVIVLVRSLIGKGTGGADQWAYATDPLTTIFTMLRVLFDYARNLVLPLWLNNRYPDRVSYSIFEYKIMLSGLCHFIGGAFLIFQIKKGSKAGLFCIMWFYITWLPASNLIPISTLMADRYIYLSAVGFYLGLALTFARLLQALANGKSPHTMPKYMVGGGMILLIIFWMFLSIDRNRDWKNSQTLWADSLKKNPGNCNVYSILGKLLSAKGLEDRAIRIYNKGIHFCPNDATIYYNLGNSWFSLGNIKKALQAFTKSVHLDPDHLEARHNLAVCMMQLGAYENGIEQFKRVLESNPENIDVYKNIIKGLISVNRLDEAIIYQKKLLRRKTDDIETLFSLADTLMKIGRYDDALHYYEVAVKLKPGIPEAYNNMGKIMALQKKNDQALVFFGKAIELNPSHFEAQFNSGSLYFMMGRYAEALKHFDASLTINPNHVETHYLMGSLLILQKQYASAEYHLLIASKQRPNSLKIWYKLMEVYEQSQQFGNALLIAEKALSIARAEGKTRWVQEMKNRINGYRGRLDVMN